DFLIPVPYTMRITNPGQLDFGLINPKWHLVRRQSTNASSQSLPDSALSRYASEDLAYLPFQLQRLIGRLLRYSQRHRKVKATTLSQCCLDLYFTSVPLHKIAAKQQPQACSFFVHSAFGCHGGRFQ